MKVMLIFVYGLFICMILCIFVLFVEGLGMMVCIVIVLFGFKFVFDV